MDNIIYYQRNWEKLINKGKEYYQNDNERLREQARNKYRNLSEEDKEKKREYGRNRYRNMSEEKKQELKEYHKQRYRETKKSKNNDLWLNIVSSVKYYDLKDFLKVRFVKKGYMEMIEYYV